MMTVSNRKRTLLLAMLIFAIVTSLVAYPYWSREIRQQTQILTGAVGHFIQKTVSYTSLTTACYSNLPLDDSKLTENADEYQVNYSRCRPAFIKQSDRELNLPVVTSAFFRSLGNAIIDAAHPYVDAYHVTRPNDIIYIGQEFYEPFVKYMPSINASFVLISHWNDLNISVAAYRTMVEHPHLIVWFSTNAVDEHKKLRIIPQGLWPEGLYGWQRNATATRDMALNMVPFKERKTLLFTSFWETHIRWPGRLHLNKQLYSQFPNRTDIVFSPKGVKWPDYMRTMGESKFAISPTGRGLDCFRTWEALFVGTVPIVLNSSIIHLYTDMPIMIVNDYREVTVEKLAAFEQTLKFRNGIITPRYKLWARYWLQEIAKYLPKTDY